MGAAAYAGKSFKGRAVVSGKRTIGATSCRQQHNQAHGRAGGDSAGPRTPTTPRPPRGLQPTIVKGASLRFPCVPKAPDAPRAPKVPEGKFCPLCTPTPSLNPTPTLTPTPTLSLVPTLPLPPTLTLTRIEYWDRAGGTRNIICESSTKNEVRTGKWMKAAQKGLKMSCIHPFGHHNWTRIIFGKSWF